MRVPADPVDRVTEVIADDGDNVRAGFRIDLHEVRVKQLGFDVQWGNRIPTLCIPDYLP